MPEDRTVLSLPQLDPARDPAAEERARVIERLTRLRASGQLGHEDFVALKSAVLSEAE